MAGLFFCLASAEGAGLFFVLLQYSHIQAFTTAFIPYVQFYTAHATKQCTRLYRRFSGYLPCFAAIVWRCIQLYRTACATLDARTLCRPAQPPYSNKVYKGAEVPACYRSMPDGVAHRRPCQPGGGLLLPSADHWQALHPAHLLRGQRLHLCRVSPAACDLAPVRSQGAPAGTFYPAGQSSGRGAEPLTATAVPLFGLSPDS